MTLKDPTVAIWSTDLQVLLNIEGTLILAPMEWETPAQVLSRPEAILWLVNQGVDSNKVTAYLDQKNTEECNCCGLWSTPHTVDPSGDVCDHCFHAIPLFKDRS